jgi:hypothetical protein
VERHYPSFVEIAGGGQGGVRMGINEGDVRARIVKRNQEIDVKREDDRRRAAGEPAPVKEDDSLPWEIFAFVSAVIAIVVAMGAFIAWFIITYYSD